MTEATNVVELRRYQLVEVKGETQMACRLGTRWEFDTTCKSINEMLSNGLLDESTAMSVVQHLSK